MRIFRLKVWWILGSVLFFATSCLHHSPSEISRSGVITKDTMILLLTDMHLADADAQSKMMVMDSMQRLYKQSFESIFNHYKINTNRFKKSLKFYTEHPKEMDDIYVQVISNLSKLNN